MWFAYIDESKDPGHFCVYTALITNGERWGTVFERIKDFRRQLRDEHGIYIAKELHAWKFASGRGRIAPHPISKAERADIFRKVLRFVGESKSFAVVSSCHTNEQYAFERMMNRLNRTAVRFDARLLCFFDEGEEIGITKRIRRMRVHNPIPSNQGVWVASGKATKNIVLSNIVEDPVFKDSAASFFIQLADFCAYALLRSERPIASRTALGYNTMYDELRTATRRFTNPSDPRGMGIIR